MAAVRREQGVVGLAANTLQGGDAWLARVAAVGDADCLGVEQAVNEAVLGQVGQPHDARALAAGHAGGHIGQQFQRRGVEHLDAARLVVLRHHQAAVGADGAAYRVAGLHDAVRDALLQHVHARQAAVAAEDKGVARIAREHHRGMGQVAQALHAPNGLAPAGVDQGERASGALDDHADVTRALDGVGCGGGGRGLGGCATTGQQRRASGE